MATKKLELLDWLMHITDTNLLLQVEKVKQQISQPKSNQPVFGRLKGKIQIAPDFDNSLNDFKDYM